MNKQEESYREIKQSLVHMKRISYNAPRYNNYPE